METAPEPQIVDTQTGYDLWSEIYDSDGNPLLILEEPQVADLLGDVAGLEILDVGCGTGRHSLGLAAAGAKVTAIDFSRGMLEKARAKPNAEKVTFREHDLRLPLPFASRSYDRVICCLVLDHVADVNALLSEMERVVRTDGFIVISVMHPAMMLRGIQARFHDPKTGADVRPESVPNQISTYVTAAVSAGLHIAHISEHMVDERLAERAPRARKYLGWPTLLMLKLRPTTP